MSHQYSHFHDPVTLEELRHACLGLGPIDGRLCYINEELRNGLDFISKYPQAVTVYGSARYGEDNFYYQKARELGRRLAEDFHDYAVVTGGGPGIMEAANRGAKEANGTSLGITIRLPKEQHANLYVTDHVDFYYFFTRKVILSFSALAYVCFPGGFGTMDEFFEIMTLVQTGKIPHVPIVLYGKSFWYGLDNFIKQELLVNQKNISPDDILLYKITDDLEEIVEIVRSAPQKVHRDIQAELTTDNSE